MLDDGGIVVRQVSRDHFLTVPGAQTRLRTTSGMGLTEKEALSVNETGGFPALPRSEWHPEPRTVLGMV
jgi:hypothetical protein